MPWSEVIRSPRCVFQDFTIACTRHHAANPGLVKTAAQLSKIYLKQTIAACHFFFGAESWSRVNKIVFGNSWWVLKSGGLSVSGNAMANTPVNNRWQKSDLIKTCKQSGLCKDCFDSKHRKCRFPIAVLFATNINEHPILCLQTYIWCFRND